MDPNTALANLRQAYSDWEDARGHDGTSPSAVDAADRMRDAAVALDQWLSADGFLPDDWQQPDDGVKRSRVLPVDDREITHWREDGNGVWHKLTPDEVANAAARAIASTVPGH